METNVEHKTDIRLDATDRVQNAIIITLLYFDIFDYPLTFVEIYENCQGYPYTSAEIKTALKQLESSSIILMCGDFYCLKGRKEIAEYRPLLNSRAESFLPAARKISRFISYFPFVEAIFITGSLAKNSMKPDGDIDYFIITRPGRLWVCRAMLMLFKKVFLFNSKKYFCINYYVDSASLEIPDENIFTATEIVFAKATYNASVCRQFFINNQWVFNYYPNKPLPDLSLAQKPNKSVLKYIPEKILSGVLGERADALLFKIFMHRWRKKFGYQPKEAFEINFRSRKNISKHHPNGYQMKVLTEFEKRIHQFSIENDMRL